MKVINPSLKKWLKRISISLGLLCLGIALGGYFFLRHIDNLDVAQIEVGHDLNHNKVWDEIEDLLARDPLLKTHPVLQVIMVTQQQANFMRFKTYGTAEFSEFQKRYLGLVDCELQELNKIMANPDLAGQQAMAYEKIINHEVFKTTNELAKLWKVEQAKNLIPASELTPAALAHYCKNPFSN